MLTHPKAPDLTLYEVTDTENDAVGEVLDWARTYLSRPHPELGRTGPVCPYVPTSMRKGLFYVGVQRGAQPDPAAVRDTMLRYRDWFCELEPSSGVHEQFKTFLVAFPDVSTADAPAIIDSTQAELKPAFVRVGLMIGQFHSAPPEEAGLWNADFRPLRSPLPLLAIRRMVAADLPFLDGDRRFIEPYLDRFGDAVPPRLQDRLLLHRS